MDFAFTFAKQIKNLTMKTTLNNLNLKKGQEVFFFGTWSGNEGETIDFYIQEFTVHSIGKVRAYLLIDNDINVKRSFSSDNYINAELTFDAAIESCKKFIPEHIQTEIEWYTIRSTKGTESEQYYRNCMIKILNNLKTAKHRLFLNPYSKTNKQIINL